VSEVCGVTKAEEYRQNAAKCREVARTASPIHRQQLEEMAETWERLESARRHRFDLLRERLKEAHTGYGVACRRTLKQQWRAHDFSCR